MEKLELWQGSNKNPFQTKCNVPTKEELEKRNEAIEKLKSQKIVFKAAKIIQKFLKQEGLENAFINIQVFPEYCEESHWTGETYASSQKGNQYYLATNLNTNV